MSQEPDLTLRAIEDALWAVHAAIDVVMRREEHQVELRKMLRGAQDRLHDARDEYERCARDRAANPWLEVLAPESSE